MDVRPLRIKLNVPGGTEITWRDGQTSILSHALLRRSCPCATCKDRPPDPVEESPDSLPIVGQEPVKPVSATPIGHYALQISWNDGHEAGIYPFEYLRELCGLQSDPLHPDSGPSDHSQ